MKRVAAMLFAAVLTLLPACGGVSESSGQTVSVNGSTSVERVILTLAERYMLDHPETKIVYDPTGTGAGLEAVRNNPQAVGYASLASVEGRSGIRILTINGAPCTEKPF